MDDACRTAALGDQVPFVTLDDLREEERTTFVVVVRDKEQQSVMRTLLVASPDRFKPGGEACEFSVVRLRLSLAADGTAQVVSDF